ncbi:hypothetical protein KC960_01895 [Candidatus Saccharibacteria bacterium]|nr:hypothetical protein [Candidatus Saccharibacteria bacterium]
MLKLGNKNKDKLLIVLAFISIFGSVIVYRSYAANNQKDISKPGTYSISVLANYESEYYNIENNQPLIINSNINSNYTYCIYGYSSDSGLLLVSFGSTEYTFQFEPNNDNYEIGCLNFEENGILSGDIKVSSTNDIHLSNLVVK